MVTPENSEAFEVQRESVERYFYLYQILSIILIGVWFWGLGIIVAVIHSVTLGPWLTRKQSEELKYWLEGRTLRVDYGVFFLKRKAIPLDRITDIVLTQGPILRHCGIWGLQIQTAGTGQAVPEATLYGVVDHEKVRDRLLAARDAIMSRTL